jgi:hypothetical protein
MLRAGTHVVDFSDQVSQIAAAGDEIDLGCVHHQKRALVVVEKVLAVRLSHFGEVFQRYASLVRFISLFQAFVKDIGPRL